MKDFYSRIIEAVNFKVKCDLGIGRKIQLLYIALNLYIAASLVWRMLSLLFLVQTEISQKLFDKLPLN